MYLQRHIVSNSKENPYKCSYCDKSSQSITFLEYIREFILMKNYIKEILITYTHKHSQWKKYINSFIALKVLRENQLRIHFRTHNDEKSILLKVLL